VFAYVSLPVCVRLSVVCFRSFIGLCWSQRCLLPFVYRFVLVSALFAFVSVLVCVGLSVICLRFCIGLCWSQRCLLSFLYWFVLVSALFAFVFILVCVGLSVVCFRCAASQGPVSGAQRRGHLPLQVLKPNLSQTWAKLEPNLSQTSQGASLYLRLLRYELLPTRWWMQHMLFCFRFAAALTTEKGAVCGSLDHASGWPWLSTTYIRQLLSLMLRFEPLTPPCPFLWLTGTAMPPPW
jgi:hypothetical protein